MVGLLILRSGYYVVLTCKLIIQYIMTDKFCVSAYVLPGSKAHKFFVDCGHTFVSDVKTQMLYDYDGFPVMIAKRDILLVSGFTSGSAFHKFLKCHGLSDRL